MRTVQKMKFLVKDFFSKCDQMHSFRRIWLRLLKKSKMENFIFCVVVDPDLVSAQKQNICDLSHTFNPMSGTVLG